MRAVLCLLVPVLAAQDLDVAGDARRRKPVTVLDQIENAAERNAFLELYGATEPAARKKLAARFLERFPDSWLLPQIYEAAARAAFELDDYTPGLAQAKLSLELYPENPLLLGTVAAVQANLGHTAAAVENARETLDLLQRFAHPAAMPEREWKTVEEHLRRSALQVLAAAGVIAAPPSMLRPVPNAASDYAGSAACQRCHAAEFAAWRQTGMARMLQPVAADRVVGNFAGAGNIAGGIAKASVKGTDYFLELRRSTGIWDRFKIDYVIGSKWQQAYATRTRAGELHVLPLQYNLLSKEWINYWRIIDPPQSERAEPGEFHRLRSATAYQPNCAPCHTSQADDKGFAEPGVNCEMCHGPGAAHARGTAAQSRFQQLSDRDSVNICAQCHAQSALRQPQGFPPRYLRRPYVEFSRKAFYRDGRFRETTFIVEAFERSACYRKGQAQCAHCHDPHPADAATNPKSLKFAADPDRLCVQCHAASYAQATHTKHAAQSEASRCVSCHMPRIMNSLLFKARSHQIDDRPRPQWTERFGTVESPDTCLECHTAKTPAWTREQLASW